MPTISATTAALCLELLGQANLNALDPDLVAKAQTIATARDELTAGDD